MHAWCVLRWEKLVLSREGACAAPRGTANKKQQRFKL